MAECVTVDELDGPIDQSDDTAEKTETDFSDYVSLCGFLLLSYTDCLAEHIDQRHDERSKADTAETICHCATEGPACSTTGHTAWFSTAEEPRPVHACDGRVKGILDPFRDPVSRKRYKDKKTYDFCGRTASVTGRIGGRTALVGLIFDVHGHERDTEPGAKGKSYETPNCAGEEHVPESFCNIHCCLKH